MPKTGKERKARRRARQAAEAARASHTAPGGASDVGSVKASPLSPDAPSDLQEARAAAEAELVEAAGTHWHTGGNEVAERANQRLVHRSLRWLTDGDGESFEGRPTKKMSHKELALLQTRRAISSPDLKTAIGLGVRTLIALEAQNQRDDLSLDPFKAPPVAPAVPLAGTGDAPPAANVQVNIIMPDNGRGPQSV